MAASDGLASRVVVTRSALASLHLHFGGLHREGVSGSNLNTERLENEIESGIEEQTGAEVTSVDCPDTVKIEKGNVFNCTATDDQGETGTVRVTQQDDKGNVKWQLNP